MLVDGISRQQLQDMAIAALIGAGTMAAERVYIWANYPTRVELFPLLMVSVPRERRIAIYPGQLDFNTTMSLVVVGRVAGLLAPDVGALLGVLEDQILEAILLSTTITQAVQEFRVIETQTVVTADGKQQVGEIGVTIEAVLFQSYGPSGDPLTSITAATPIEGGSATPAPIVNVQILPLPETC